jgi:hypothetical protein
MSRSQPTLSPEVRALLDGERAIPPQPAAVRARALARAHAAIVAGSPMQSAPPRAVPRIPWVATATLIGVAGMVGAGAYEIRGHWAHAPSRPAPAPTVAEVATPPAPSAATAAAEPTSAPSGSIGTAQSPTDAAPAELRLLRQARTAVARGDFAGALPPIAEHARRFKNGRLAEEREALRVKALAGLGRTEEARRAATAFEGRFPHSVLLPTISQLSGSEP